MLLPLIVFFFVTALIVGGYVAAVRPASGETVYAKTGEIFGISCSILTILAFIFSLRGSHGIRIDGRENIGA